MQRKDNLTRGLRAALLAVVAVCISPLGRGGLAVDEPVPVGTVVECGRPVPMTGVVPNLTRIVLYTWDKPLDAVDELEIDYYFNDVPAQVSLLQAALAEHLIHNVFHFFSCGPCSVPNRCTLYITSWSKLAVTWRIEDLITEVHFVAIIRKELTAEAACTPCPE